MQTKILGFGYFPWDFLACALLRVLIVLSAAEEYVSPVILGSAESAMIHLYTRLPH